MIIILPSALCFAANLILGNGFWVILGNVLIFWISVVFALSLLGKKLKDLGVLYLSVFSLLPLFHLPGRQTAVVFMVLLIILLLNLSLKVRVKWPIFLVLIISSAFLSLYLNNLVRFPFTFQSELIIFTERWGNQAILEMKNQALYLPFPLRGLVFNRAVYLYSLLANLAEFFNIKNFSEVIFIGNLYPLIGGVVNSFKRKVELKPYLFFFLLPVVIANGLSRFTDNQNTFLLLSPIILVFCFLGLEKINKRIYFLLLVLSLIIYTSPLK